MKCFLEFIATVVLLTTGAEGSVIIGKVLDSDDPGFGYDASNGTFGDMVKNGILDPLKVFKNSAFFILTKLNSFRCCFLLLSIYSDWSSQLNLGSLAQ